MTASQQEPSFNSPSPIIQTIKFSEPLILQSKATPKATDGKCPNDPE